MPATVAEDFREMFRTTLLIAGTLVPIVSPFGNAPLFLTMTQGVPASTRTVIARKVALNGFILLVGSVFVGTYVLAFFGISLPVVQVGGGIVVMATGWRLLHAQPDECPSEGSSALSESSISSRAFYPLTLPLTVGPGSISAAIAVGANRREGFQYDWPVAVAQLLGPAIVAVTIYVCYRYAAALARALGDTAMNVIVRLSSFILLCIGVQILWNGVSALLAVRS